MDVMHEGCIYVYFIYRATENTGATENTFAINWTLAKNVLK